MPKVMQHIWVKLTFFGLLLTIFCIAGYGLKIFTVPIILGFLIAFLLEPIVSKLEGKGLLRVHAIAVVLTSIALTIIVTFIFLAPRVYDEINELNKNKGKYIEFAEAKYQFYKVKVEESMPKKIPWETVDSEVNALKLTVPAKISAYAIKTASSGLESFLNFFIIIPIFAFFVMKDGMHFKKWAIHFVPNRYFEMVMELIYNINHQIGQFIRGQLVDCVINAFMVSTLLGLIGLPYFFIVGIFAGIANAIPFVGPVAAGSLGVLVTLLADGPNPLLVIGAFGVAHLIDVMFIYPSTVGHSLKLHELVVILGIMIGGHIGGIIGMLVIIPIIGILKGSTQVMYKLLRGYNII
jgi:predicted PurR-regulated permease PerM